MMEEAERVRERESGLFLEDGEGMLGRQEEEVSSGASSETVLTKSEKPSKRLARWRHVMELPGNDGDAEKLWNFVAAHVEDKWRKKPCPLAEKAWKQLTGKVMVGYKSRRAVEVGGIPRAMPGRLASWRRQGGANVVVDWSEKYAERRSGRSGADW